MVQVQEPQGTPPLIVDLRAYIRPSAGSAEPYRALLQLQGAQPEGKALSPHNQRLLPVVRLTGTPASEPALVTDFFNHNFYECHPVLPNRILIQSIDDLRMFDNPRL